MITTVTLHEHTVYVYANAVLTPHLLGALPGLCLQECGHCDHAPHDAVVATLELIAGLIVEDCDDIYMSGPPKTTKWTGSPENN